MLRALDDLLASTLRVRRPLPAPPPSLDEARVELLTMHLLRQEAR